MSTAFSQVTVRVVEVSADGRIGIAVASQWRKNNLLFLHGEEGQALLSRLHRWAIAEDENGRSYLLWEADHPRYQGLVIQPFDSRYCFEVSPVEDLGKVK
jgi:hypothetical protein